MRPIAASYDDLCDDAIAALDLELEERAIARAERRLGAILEGRSALVDGVACRARLVAGAIILGTEQGLRRVLRVERPEALVLAARALDLPSEGTSLLEAVRRGRRRRSLLLERARLRRERQASARRRASLDALRAVEIEDAERRRLALLARERRRGVPAPASPPERTVPQVVSAAARALADQASALDAALGRCSAALADADTIRGREDAALLDGLAAFSRLLAERIALEYRRFERAVLRDLRSFAEGVPEGGADVPSPVGHAARRGPLGGRRLVQRLAFLMSKANFVPVPHSDLSRGFSIGPAPGLRLVVPLAEAAAAHIFARGVHMEPIAGGKFAPRFERFAFCWLERPSPRRRRLRAARDWLTRLRRRIRVLFMRSARRRVGPSVRRAVEIGRVLAAAPVAVGDAAPPPITIKIFADVRLGEAGLVLPGAAIRYRPRDLMLVLGGVLGGLWSKVSTSPLATLLTAKIALPLAGVAAFRGLMGMRRSRVTLDKLREEYENRHLLATRLHAVDFFLREAAETDAKEAFAAYSAMLLESVEEDAPPSALLRGSASHLRAIVEAYQSARMGREVRFDIEDAIGGLEACGLVPQGFFAPGEPPPDFFDPRVTGETVKRDADTLFVAPPGPDTARPTRHPSSEDGLRAALQRLERKSPSPSAQPVPSPEPPSTPALAPPPAPLHAPAPAPSPSPAPSPTPTPLPASDLSREVVLLPLEEAVRRLRADLRRRLDLDDAPLGAGVPHGARGDVERRLGERFTL